MRIICFLLLVLIASSVKSQAPFDTALAVRNNRGIYSLVIAVKNQVVYANTFNGQKENDLRNHQSLTKSLDAVLVGIAIDKGFIPSIQTRLCDILPALKNDPDKRKQQITIADVMNQASGLWHENLDRLDRYLGLPDPSGYVWQQPLLSDPGAELHYNNAASHLVSVILTKATGQSTLEFARQYLFAPLGIEQVEWPLMKDGYNDGSGLLSVRMRTADMNKIGRLILDSGRYNGQQLVAAQWTQALLHPPKTYPAPWGLRNTTYGLFFYHKTFKGTAITYGMGWGGQFLILIPSLDAVISVNQAVDDRNAIRQSGVFMEEIFPLIFDWIQRGAGLIIP
ncbi:MAG: serine hydrolase [Chitinophaga sp.]|uniref:serine hydrolase domain-containing protein n=1 Tax=Chitinophaga sp. TaxID=1869181 RepID=UPI001B2C66ED|nr:serine hydrolase [Chitinophaga sp.]MBO9731449.1 serine hydrolase [Chitinophaga sp.]